MDVAYSILVSAVWFLSTYFMVVFILILITQKDRLFVPYPDVWGDSLPKVSMVISAFNEEATIKNSIESLKEIDYPKDKLEIIIVNDGSRDKTYEIAKKCLKGCKNIRLVDNALNKGKAKCLNQGILMSHGDYVATMDADSEVSADIIRKTVPYFKDNRVGAVTVSVEVKDPKNFLEKLIDIEYIIGLSLSLKALSFINAVHVTPGPFSIYSRKALDRVGLFDAGSITEDLEIAYRMQRFRYRIENCSATKVRTVIPNTLRRLYVQRKRWYSGALLTLLKHRDMIFNSSMGSFSIVMPYTFLVTATGLLLFSYSVFLIIKNLIKWLSFYSLTGFNFITHLSHIELDPLTATTLTFLGIISMVFIFVGAVTCLKLSGNALRKKATGIAGFFLLFFLYQFFWASSLVSVVLRRKVKWR